MKTISANHSERREEIAKQLNLNYTVKNGKIFTKDNSGKTLVEILVTQEVKNRKAGMYPDEI
jgi:hypothetical protein